MRKHLNSLLSLLGYELRKRARGSAPEPVAGQKLQDKPEKKGARPTVNADIFEIIQAMEKGCSPRTIFDVGANVGRFSLECRRRFPEATIHAFEPGAAACQKLRDRFVGDDRAHVQDFALGSVAGESTFYENEYAPTNSLLRTVPTARQWVPNKAIEPVGSKAVTVSTLDLYAREHGIQNIDLLKLDTQGFDLEVLRGGQDLLDSQSVGWLYVEMLLVPFYEGQAEFRAIIDYLYEKNYALFAFHNQATSERGQLMWTNGLFCRRAVADTPPGAASTAA